MITSTDRLLRERVSGLFNFLEKNMFPATETFIEVYCRTINFRNTQQRIDWQKALAVACLFFYEKEKIIGDLTVESSLFKIQEAKQLKEILIQKNILC